jgi:hypothetical protein
MGAPVLSRIFDAARSVQALQDFSERLTAYLVRVGPSYAFAYGSVVTDGNGGVRVESPYQVASAVQADDSAHVRVNFAAQLREDNYAVVLTPVSTTDRDANVRVQDRRSFEIRVFDSSQGAEIDLSANAERISFAVFGVPR